MLHQNKVKICVVCNNEFIPMNNNKITCSDVCKWKRKYQINKKIGKERTKEIKKKSYEKNKEVENKRTKEYRENNMEKCINLNKKWKENNKERISKYDKQWRKNNSLRKNLIAQKRRNNIKGKISYDDLIKRLNIFNGCCYCKKDKKLTMEHLIPISKKGLNIYNNVFGACKKCNLSKNNKDFLLWYRDQSFYSPKREYEILQYSLEG